jgi:hypothetical protein
MIRKGFDDFITGEGVGVARPAVFMRLKLGQPPYLFESIRGGFPDAQKRRIRHGYDLIEIEWEVARMR